MSATDKLIEDLRGRAQKATKGPWTLVVGSKGELYIRTDDDVEVICREFPRDEDAEFLAACEPEAILAILDTIARVEEDLRVARQEADAMRSQLISNARGRDAAETERDRWCDAAQQTSAKLTEANAKLEALMAALEPFEELADEGNEDQPDDTKVVVYAGRSIIYTLQLSDLRRARDACRALI